jgi:hypothetical protein
MFVRSKALPVRKADNLTGTCEPISDFWYSVLLDVESESSAIVP